MRRRRAAGDFPPSFERKLDELFARFTPTGTHDDHFTDALKLADRSAYFDAQVPFGSRRRPQGFTKWVLWNAEAWFVNYVVRQLNHFSASVMRVVHLLDERLGEVEREVEMLVVPALPDEDAISPGADPAPFIDLLSKKLSDPRAPEGRVLHAECGDGVADRRARRGGHRRLRDRSGQRSGRPCSREGPRRAPRRRARASGVGRGRQARRARPVRLRGPDDHRGAPAPARARGAQAGSRRDGRIARDLATGPGQNRSGRSSRTSRPSGPWHAATWAYLLSQMGFIDVSSFAGPVTGGLGRADAGDADGGSAQSRARAPGAARVRARDVLRHRDEEAAGREAPSDAEAEVRPR